MTASNDNQLQRLENHAPHPPARDAAAPSLPVGGVAA